MSDDKLRNLERDALFDLAAAEKLKHERCRVGQCCACRDLAPSIPGPPGEAYGANVIIENVDYQQNIHPIYLGGPSLGPTGYSLGTPNPANIYVQGETEVTLTLRFIGRGAAEASMWMRTVFEVHNPGTGIMDVRNLGSRLIPAQKPPPDPVVPVIEPPASMNRGRIFGDSSDEMDF